MTTIPPAPLDPEQVALALAPFGESRLLPRDAYVSDEVLEWERRYLFDAWMCVGALLRRPGHRAAGRVGRRLRRTPRA
jgi:hypothetical protein